MILKPDDQAPELGLPTGRNGTISLAKLRGRSASGTTVIGISSDGVASHDRSKAKHGPSFTLAVDAKGKVCEAYGTWV